MLDFLNIKVEDKDRNKVTVVYPAFKTTKSKDLMIRGRDFYAIWDEREGLWSTDEDTAIRLIDEELDSYVSKHRDDFRYKPVISYMWDSQSGSIDSWHKFVQKQARDSFKALDGKLIFADTETKREDYATRKLSYRLEPCEIPAYEELMSTIFAPEEREKLEWAIGSIISGDSTKIQKFIVLYGGPGTGKSTFLGCVIQQLFDGYYVPFEASALTSRDNQFALEAFKTNPLVALQHDGDLSRIADNTKLNSIVSHEKMVINEKFKAQYEAKFQSFLFMGTNSPVYITDSKSGLNRRLIDVRPTGERLSPKRYDKVTSQIKFELGGIACHCKEVYESLGKNYYNKYEPKDMRTETDDFYNFILDHCYFELKEKDWTTLGYMWDRYKEYCEYAGVKYPYPYRKVKAELKDYFLHYEERATTQNGERVRNLYSGFITNKFGYEESAVVKNEEPDVEWLVLKQQNSIFDKIADKYPAQYASEHETPIKKWDQVDTILKDIRTGKLHYVKVPENHIVIDFDLKDENGEKSLALNMEAASSWPPTYVETSKSGNGLHLHYIYNGDVSTLSRVYSDGIEIKVFVGNSSLRRKLYLCNEHPIVTITSGLPLKGAKKVVNFDAVKNEKVLRAMIKKNLNKEYLPATKPSVDFIFKLLEEAYESGSRYDVSDMKQSVIKFAAGSTHQSDYCLKLVSKMKFKSDDISDFVAAENDELVFYDVEVFPNLFLVNYKFAGEDKKVVRMINPTPEDISSLMKYNLVGFNCRRYDNHIMYARMNGYTNEQLYILSQNIIDGFKSAMFGEAYNLSYTDVYDFSSKKQSLKKFEIELGIHHQELGLPWDQPVPEELWGKVAAYCDNDVIATEAVFNARKADFLAREILADVAGGTVNDTTNSLTTKIIFGNNKKPQNTFNYRDLGEPCDDKPYFEGYTFEFDEHRKPVSSYRGEIVGEGGYVYAEPGMYKNVALLDIASMHPSSIVAENLFGDEYTKRFNDILQARIAIKHKDFDKARTMLNGALAKYLDDESAAADLAQALKIAINSVYGLTSAKFDNPFRDNRNKDNIVAKRGALFMVDLKHAVQERGYTVAHIKTDSIKIPDADQDIIDFVTEFGKKYGYNFEHEATYEKMCLVNDAVYIAKVKDGKHAGSWTATGTQFQVPYVFKTLFSKEPITFDDMCEAKSVTSSLYLDMGDEENHNYVFIGKVGLFCPIKPGCGGGILVREKDGKYYAATGTKGYFWLEAETVKLQDKLSDIDRSYYDRLVDEAVESISQYGDFEWFIS